MPIWFIFAYLADFSRFPPWFNHHCQRHLEEYCWIFSNLFCKSLDIIRYKLVWQDSFHQAYETWSSLNTDLVHRLFHPVSHPALCTRPQRGTGFSPASSPMAPCCVPNQSGPQFCNNCGRCTKGHNSTWQVKGLGLFGPNNEHSWDHPFK